MKHITVINHAISYANKHSDDPRLKVGACVVNASYTFGTNRFVSLPAGYTKEQLVADRDLKLKYITHAEHDAITKAGDKARGATLYVNYTPCIDCAKKIVDAKVSKVVVKRCDDVAVATRWQASWQQSITLLNDSGVEYEEQ